MDGGGRGGAGVHFGDCRGVGVGAEGRADGVKTAGLS